METREYIVCLKTNVDHDQFWLEMESPTNGLDHVPDRSVDIIKNHDAFDRLCAYALSETEAEQISQDPRVMTVEIPVEENPWIEIGPLVVQTNDFTKPTTTASAGTKVNWGLIRNSNPTNVYGTGTTTNLDYLYTYDGTGVDIVISDSGIQADHPEFQYVGNSTSRVQQINWADYNPALSTMPTPYQDPNGHGTHVAGIAAGKTYGWAKGAHIYSILAYGTGAPTVTDQFTAIINWHNSKGPNGRPTVVNMSWGYSLAWRSVGGLPSNAPVTYANLQQASVYFKSNLKSVQWYGTIYNFPAIPPTPLPDPTQYGILVDETNYDCLLSLLNGIPAIVSSADIALSYLLAAGITVVKAAGNSSYKIAGPKVNYSWDQYNYFTSYVMGPTQWYYTQGSSPVDNPSDITAPSRTISVGNQDSVAYDATQDQKATSSMTGPGVDLYAAGTNILSACTSNTSATLYSLSSTYFLDGNFRQLNIGGTSMASPQIAGLSALYLQKNTLANNLSANNSLQVKSWLTTNSTATMYSPGNATTYTNFRSTLGGNAIIAYSYQSPTPSVNIKDDTGTWQTATNVYLKTDSSTWIPVQYIYIKTDSATWTQTV